jgi:hypothetical protein
MLMLNPLMAMMCQAVPVVSYARLSRSGIPESTPSRMPASSEASGSG